MYRILQKETKVCVKSNKEVFGEFYTTSFYKRFCTTLKLTVKPNHRFFNSDMVIVNLRRPLYFGDVSKLVGYFESPVSFCFLIFYLFGKLDVKLTKEIFL